MSEVVVVGSFKANPGKEEEALEAFKALVEPTHDEDGCILYALHRGVDDPAPPRPSSSAGRRASSSTRTSRAPTCRRCWSARTSCGATTARSRCTRPSRRASRRRARWPSTRAADRPHRPAEDLPLARPRAASGISTPSRVEWDDPRPGGAAERHPLPAPARESAHHGVDPVVAVVPGVRREGPGGVGEDAVAAVGDAAQRPGDDLRREAARVSARSGRSRRPRRRRPGPGRGRAAWRAPAAASPRPTRR